MYFYGIDDILEIMLTHLLLINFTFPKVTYNLEWNEDMHYGLVEVVGQYFKVITVYQEYKELKLPTQNWAEKHDYGEKYYASMVKNLKQKKCHETTNDEFYVTLNFLFDILEGKEDISNMNLPEFRKYCIEAGHFYVAALILDDYFEQLDTKPYECMCDMMDAFYNVFHSKFPFLSRKEETKNVVNSIYRMPMKDWWHKYGFTADRDDCPSPTEFHYFIFWWELPSRKIKPSPPTPTWENSFGNQLNNDNNDSVSPYLDVNLRTDDVFQMLDEKEGKTNGDDDLAMMALTKYNQVTKHIWLADSGTSSHMCIQDDGMFNVKMVLFKVTIGNGNLMVSPKLGDIWMTFQTKEGKKMFLLWD